MVGLFRAVSQITCCAWDFLFCFCTRFSPLLKLQAYITNLSQLIRLFKIHVEACSLGLNFESAVGTQLYLCITPEYSWLYHPNIHCISHTLCIICSTEIWTCQLSMITCTYSSPLSIHGKHLDFCCSIHHLCLSCWSTIRLSDGCPFRVWH